MNDNIEEVYSVKIEKDPESGAVISQTWFNHEGKEENPTGPSHVRYDPKTGEPRRMEWKTNGEYNRDERLGPACVQYDPSNGELFEEFYRNGIRHRLAGPAIVVSNKHTGEIIGTRIVRDGRFDFEQEGGSNIDPSP